MKNSNGINRVALRSGISLVGISVALFILSLATFLFVKTQGNFLSLNEKISEGLKGQEVLVAVASQLQSFDFERIVGLCEKKDANNRTAFDGDVAGSCLENGELAPLSSQPTYTEGDALLNTRLNESQYPDENGSYCIELRRCDYVAGQLALDFELKGYWLANRKDTKPVSRILKSRRARR